MTFRRILNVYLKACAKENQTSASLQLMIEAAYKNSASLWLANIIAGILCTIAICRHATPPLYGAAAALTGVTILQGLMISHYSKRHSDMKWTKTAKRVMKPRELCLYDVSHAACGIFQSTVTGLIALANAQDMHDTLMLLTSLMMIVAYAAVILSRDAARPQTVQAEITIAIMPLTTGFILSNTTGLQFIGLLLVVFLFSIASSARSLYETLRQAITNEIKNEALAIEVKTQADFIDAALNQISSGIVMSDENNKIRVINAKMGEITGLPIENWNGCSCEDMYARLAAVFDNDTLRKIGLQQGRRSNDGKRLGDECFLIEDKVNNLIYEFSQTVTDRGGRLLIVTDVTEKQAKENAILRLANHDSLTGLANRLSLAQSIPAKLASMKESEQAVMMFLDLDGFKAVNDHYGHDIGDQLLVQVAERLRQATRRSDTLGRLGGDEFIMFHISSSTKNLIDHFAQGLIKHISEPYLINGLTIKIGASAGMSMSPKGTDYENLIRAADIAMYQAKTNGKGQVNWFSADAKQLNFKEDDSSKTLNESQTGLQDHMSLTEA